MLSLKGRMRLPTAPPMTLLDLPPEILTLIIRYLTYSSPCRLSFIKAASRVCRSLRKACLPLLFERLSLTVILKESDDHGHVSTLQNLLDHSHILPFIRQLCIYDDHFSAKFEDEDEMRRIAADIDYERGTENILDIDLNLSRLSRQVSTIVKIVAEFNVHTLRFSCSEWTQKLIMTSMPKSKTNLQIILNNLYECYINPTMGIVPDSPLVRGAKGWKIVGAFYNLARGILNPKTSYLIKHADFLSGANSESPLAPSAGIEEMWSSPKIYHIMVLLDLRMAPTPSYLKSIRRLHVSFWNGLEGDYQLQLYDLLVITAKHFPNLKEFRINAGYPATHPSCTFSPSEWTLPYRVTRVGEMCDFAEIPQLTRLELHGVCSHVPMEKLCTANLTSLALHGHKSDLIWGEESQRSWHDIKLLAELSPNLDTLALDAGEIGKLWHPLAVPGVDVDVRQYRFLDNISRLPKLRRLKLCPRYPRDMAAEDDHTGRNLISDGQVLRVFRYIKSNCPTLELLIIRTESRYEVFDTGSGKTVLVVQPKGAGYEQRQIWVGEKRLTTEIVRYPYRWMGWRPYDFDDDWIVKLPSPFLCEQRR